MVHKHEKQYDVESGLRIFAKTPEEAVKTYAKLIAKDYKTFRGIGWLRVEKAK